MSELPNDCVAPETFPRRPDNRPGLPHFAYRIGEYSEIRDFLLRQINRAPALKHWTHRGPDDPGIALLEGAAVVGDILTFYQEHYANEAFLRTAQWRESIANLVRLLGYRLAPGLGGSGRFAFEVKGDRPITIPAGYPVKAELDEVPDTVDFETASELTAHPHLSRFSLYRERRYTAGLAAGATSFEIASAGGESDAASLLAVDLKAGDKLYLVASEPSWTRNNAGSKSAQHAPQLVKVKAVTHLLGRCIVDLETPIRSSWSETVRAYRVNRTFRHFGFNAPKKEHTSILGTGGKVEGTYESSTDFRRHMSGSCGETSSSVTLEPDIVPLDQEVSDLTLETTLLWQAPVEYNSTRYHLILPRKIIEISAGPISFGDQQGSSTFVTLNAPLVTNDTPTLAYVDIRKIRVHEATSPMLVLRRTSAPQSGAITAVNQLSFYGTAAEAKTLKGRTLIFQADDGRLAEATVQQIESVSGLSTSTPGMRPLVLSTVLTGFNKSDFDEAAPAVTVFGNVADATQGKTQPKVALGNGDSRETFQTFKLPKAPLTYFNSATATPPQVPELTVHVADRAWTRVDSFFGHGPLEEIYIVREDTKGDSWIQFGDGLTGARLPSGLKNVTAVYRVGSGAHGSLKPEAKIQLGSRIHNLDKGQLPGVIAGGADPEKGEKARAAAPAGLQSLGRIVSLADYEAETLTLAGVAKATATWDQRFGIPSVVLTVLLEAGRADEYAAVKAAILAAQRGRGSDRHPISVRQAFLRYVYLNIEYAFDSVLQEEHVASRLRLALGFAGSEEEETAAARGLFTLDARRIGDSEYATRIEGHLQQVAGIRWCKVTAFGLLGAPATAVEDPTAFWLPAEPKPLSAKATCLPNELLQLHATHLKLSAVS